MAKDDLKNKIKGLNLDTDLDGLICEMIDSSQEVNNTLLNSIADVLDLSATADEIDAEMLSDEAENYKEVAKIMSSSSE